MLVASFGMMLFFMLGAALRSAGDARTPLRLGVVLTVLNVILNVILIAGLGPNPALGAAGAALGTVIAGATVSGIAVWLLCSGRLVVVWSRGMSWRPDWSVIRALFRFGLPTGVQGIAMNVAGVLLLRFGGSLEQSAQAQAAYAVGYTELFSLITWTSVGLMGAAAAVAGQNLGAGRPDRSIHAVHVTAGIGLGVAVVVARCLHPATPVRPVRHGRSAVPPGTGCSAFWRVGPVHHMAPIPAARHRRHNPRSITIVSQLVVPIGLCALIDATRGLEPAHIWLAIVLGHATRAGLSALRFRQGKWRGIRVDIEPVPS
jgi:Na+-driven multidrug efflux pump